MKNILVLLCLSFLFANCKSAGDEGSASLVSSLDPCATCGDYIANDIDQLGPRAKNLIENFESFNDFFFTLNHLGDKAFADAQMLFAARAYVNATLVTTSMSDLCTELSLVYDDFGIDNTIVTLQGGHHSFPNSSQYCVVEAHLPHADVVMDVALNRSYIPNVDHRQDWSNIDSVSTGGLSVEHILYAIENGLEHTIDANPDGFINPMVDWNAPALGTFANSFEDLGFANANDGRADLEFFMTQLFQSIVE